MKIVVSEHIAYLSGYMDAVGRMLSTEHELIGLNAREVDSVQALEQEFECEVRELIPVSSMALDFEKGVSSLFEVDPKNRVIFYLTEYVSWFEEYAASCITKKVVLNGKSIPEKYLAWLLELNGKRKVFILLCRAIKNA